MHTKKTYQIYLNWILLSLFFAYQYVLRGIPGVFSNEIRQTFGLDASQLADLGACCMLVYSCLQIPFGIALDRFGVRRLILIAFALCLTGQWIFTHASSFTTACFGRVLLGLGCAPAYIGALKWVGDTFPEKRHGLFMGITGAFGSLFVVGCNPLLKQIGLAHNDWRTPVNGYVYCGIVIFVLFLLFLASGDTKNQQESELAEAPSNFWAQLRSVAFNYKIYLYALFVIGTNVVACTLADLWGPSFLMTKYQLGEQQAVNYAQLIQTGVLFGSVGVPLLFSGGKKVLWGVRICCLILVMIFGVFIYGPHQIAPILLQGLLFGLGFFGSADILVCALSVRSATPQISGMILSWINSVSMLGEPFLQKWIGYGLDRHWAGGVTAEGLRIYQAADYESAIGVMLQVSLICCVIACLMRIRKTAALPNGNI